MNSAIFLVRIIGNHQEVNISLMKYIVKTEFSISLSPFKSYIFFNKLVNGSIMLLFLIITENFHAVLELSKNLNHQTFELLMI